MMALLDNLIAADLKKGNDIMFIMASSSCFQVATRADGGLGGQLACAAMYYVFFLTIINITKGGCGCGFGDEKGFNVGIYIYYRRMYEVSHNIQCHHGTTLSPPDRRGCPMLCASQEAPPIEECCRSHPQRICKPAR
jgi:hypothetical protein